MSHTVRCPSMCCWPSHDTGQLAFDGYFACSHCGTYLHRTEFLALLETLKAELVEWSKDIEAIRVRVES